MQLLKFQWDFDWDYLCVEVIPANTVGQRFLSLPHMAEAAKEFRAPSLPLIINESLSYSSCSITSGAFRSVSLRWKVIQWVSIVPCMEVWPTSGEGYNLPRYSAIAAQQYGAVAE